jgi:uncharacterized membrane protein
MMDPDDAMRRMTLRVRIDGSPKWLPVNADGTHWQFRSWRDRLLGDVIKVERRRLYACLPCREALLPDVPR